MHGSSHSLGCIFHKILPYGRGNEFLATLIANITNSRRAQKAIFSQVAKPSDCDSVRSLAIKKNLIHVRHSIHLDPDGRVFSNNPVWNACSRGQQLSLRLLRSNRDQFEHRQGSIRVVRPWSCRDYHRGEGNHWIYRDAGMDLVLLLGHHGKFVGFAEPLPDGVAISIRRTAKPKNL